MEFGFSSDQKFGKNVHYSPVFEKPLSVAICRSLRSGTVRDSAVLGGQAMWARPGDHAGAMGSPQQLG